MSSLPAIPSDSSKAPSGLIFNLMRFALHDGPGIRTTVFLKGCPLSCWWCHNPESQSFLPEVMFSASRCVGCAECCDHCKQGALCWENGPVRDPSLCILCGECVEGCPAEARQLMGKRITVDALLKMLARDAVFFDESGGGVTFSGGEPLSQPEFLEAALIACRGAGISTVVDTCGYASAQVVRRISKHADLFHYDLKLMDDVLHRQFVGVSNTPILENLRILAREHGRVNVRFPVIPGINDGEENLEATLVFLSEIGLRKVSLLPYHQTGSDKYTRLQAPYRLEHLAPPSPEQMQQLASMFLSMGFEVRIGG